MFKSLPKTAKHAIAAIFLGLVSAVPGHALQPVDPLVLEARKLLDTYFGDPTHLTRAADLLVRARDRDQSSSAVYVEAARLVIKGGHLSFGDYQPGTVEAYRSLLEKAIALDSSNAKAHILMAEAASKTQDYRRMKFELDSASRLDPTDPWLWIGYGRYYWSFGDAPQARNAFERVKDLGSGTSDSGRNAYVAALLGLADMEPIFPATGGLKVLALAAKKGRHPNDAWTLNSFAEDFNLRGQFSDAIDFSRDALRTMNFRAARLALAVALCGRAAELVQQGAHDEAKQLVGEARLLDFTNESILERFVDWSPAMDSVRPVVSELLSGKTAR